MADQMPWEKDWGTPPTDDTKMPWEKDWGQAAPTQPKWASTSPQDVASAQDAMQAAVERTRRSVTGGHGQPQTRTGSESEGSLEQLARGTPFGLFLSQSPAGAAYQEQHPLASEAMKWGGTALSLPVGGGMIATTAPRVANALKAGATSDIGAATIGFGVKRAANALGLPSEVGEMAGDYALAKILKRFGGH